MKKILYTILIIGGFLYWINYLPTVNATSFSDFSDRISRSWPSHPSNHTFTFKVNKAIPAGGRLVISPATTSFYIFPSLDHTDIDISTSTTLSGPYSDREVATNSTAVYDGVSVSTGASSSLSSIEITLNTSVGIASNTYARIEIGTNATYNSTGDRQIINAVATGTQRIIIETFNTSDNILDHSELAVAMVDPVVMSQYFGKVRSNGTPSGVLTFGTTESIMSLTTNYQATCRFATASGTPWTSMTDEFTFTGNYFHSYQLTGLNNGQEYNYYVRCRDSSNVDDTTDYLIHFVVSTQAGEEGEESGDPGPGGGGSGGGGGGGLGRDEGEGNTQYLPYPPLPGLPGVVLEGYGYPWSDVAVLMDGTNMGFALANSNAQWGAFLEDLNQGVYTFGVWAEDPVGRKSTTYSTTFWIDEGTQTTVSDIIIPPTIELNNTSFTAGELITITGYSVPSQTVEAWLYPDKPGDPIEAEIIKREQAVSAEGTWIINFPTSDLSNGNYRVKVRSTIESVGTSGFSQELQLSIGGAIDEGLCTGSDLNGDGKVNLVDFSILLFHWGTGDQCADQNQDGNVNLIDFSIMLFNWTG